MQSAAVYDKILKTDSKFVFMEFSISHPLLYNYYGGVCMGSLCCLLIRANKARRDHKSSYESKRTRD